MGKLSSSAQNSALCRKEWSLIITAVHTIVVVHYLKIFHGRLSDSTMKVEYIGLSICIKRKTLSVKQEYAANRSMSNTAVNRAIVKHNLMHGNKCDISQENF